MLVFLGSVQLLFDLPNSFMEYIFILMLLFGSFFFFFPFWFVITIKTKKH